jgi:DNA-directed RNA polymerase specialized sigma24 family protein
MEVFDPNQQDRELERWAIAAQQAKSPQERQRYIGRLTTIALQSNRLYRFHRARFPYRYDEIYEEARQDLLLYVTQNIEKYDPARASVMGWLNMLMKRRFIFDASQKILGKLNLEQGDLSDLNDYQLPRPVPSSLSELIIRYLREDPDQRLQEHVDGYPTATFQAIALLRHSCKVSWQDVSDEFGIPVPTLSSFYQRRLKRLGPYIREYIQQHSHL